ncbi:uncharacterized protein LOC121895717 [Thunnus maccoyii]|uniref:uncharacterized protein LOC121895717 n=1 Tax=Thunnus maccoyii TaxID=8240 RepID=UPI001C4C2B1E|nr:uncharacterized protein LOC121895717 [Thunnus maccoyii]
MLRDSLQDWRLDENKLSAIITDNTANIAIRSLHWPWLNCFSHSLNLAVTNAVQDQRQKTERALGLCCDINATFSHSWHRKRELHKKQVELGLEHSLITLCRDNVLAVSNEDVQLTDSIKTGILAKLEAKYKSDSVCELMLICTFLDPWYHGEYDSDDTALAETKILS